LVVAIHDVAPEYLDDVRYLLERLDKAAIRPRVLKVVPEHLRASPDLIALLREEQGEGSEIVLHGFSHQSHGRFRGPWSSLLRAMIFAPQAAEFLTITPTEMELRLRAGREILASAGLEVRGFCAPGWLESPDLRAMLGRTGFRYDITMTRVVDLQADNTIVMAWLGYMGAGAVQEHLVGVADGLNLLAAPLYGVVKVFLHPQGARRSSACHRILDLIPTVMRDRSLVTYGQLVGV
jgi:uncharacterized protein